MPPPPALYAPVEQQQPGYGGGPMPGPYFGQPPPFNGEQGGYGQPVYAQPGYPQPGYPSAGYAQPVYPQAGYAQQPFRGYSEPPPDSTDSAGLGMGEMLAAGLAGAAAGAVIDELVEAELDP